MTLDQEPELPEDTSRWPTDPYLLLGVDRGADAKSVKIAYTRLIRRFKPEHFPLQFRLLREAFDAVNSHASPVQWNWSDVQRIATSDPTNSNRDVELEDEKPRENKSPGASRNASTCNELQNVWMMARDGKFGAALELLTSLDDTYDLRIRTILHYWLIKLDHSDPNDDKAARHLLSNLHRLFLSEELLLIAERELQVHPKLVELIDLDSNLDAHNTNEEVLELIRLKWEASLRSGDLRHIRDDIHKLSSRFFDRRELLDIINLRAIQCLLWSDTPDDLALANKIKDETEEVSGLIPWVSQELHRIDYALLLAKEARSCMLSYPQGASVLKAIPLAWNNLRHDFAKPIMQFLIRAIERPKHALELMERLIPLQPLGQFMIFQFEQVILMYSSFEDQGDLDKIIEDDELETAKQLSKLEIGLFESFLHRVGNHSYDIFRVLLFDFCLDKNISVERLVMYATHQNTPYTQYFRSRFLTAIKGDAALVLLHNLLRKLTLATSRTF